MGTEEALPLIDMSPLVVCPAAVSGDVVNWRYYTADTAAVYNAGGIYITDTRSIAVSVHETSHHHPPLVARRREGAAAGSP